MTKALAICISLTFLGVVFVCLAWAMVWRLAPEHRRGRTLRWLGGWSLKGLLLPTLVWAAMNVGFSWQFQPFTPEIQAAKNLGDPWVPDFLRVAGTGFFIVASYWAATTLAWVLAQIWGSIEGEPRKDFKALCATSAAAMSIPAVIALFLGGWETLGLGVTGMLLPIAGYAPVLLRPKKLPPMYARAIARMKFGKYSEAEWEIIHQLEKAEDDFDGWMMLAELYARNFNDLAEAEQAVMGICDHPKTTPSQLSMALQRLADWQLNLACDPDAARRSLQMICDRLPGTHLARMSQLRLEQLPLTAEDLREQRAAQPVPLPALGENLEQPPERAEAGPERDLATKEANKCVQALRQNPNNLAVRERLARLFAEHLEQPGRGIEQLRLLLTVPDAPPEKQAHWLSQIAAWQIKFLGDLGSGRETLQRLVQEFPHSPEALAGRHRLEQMAAEAKQAAVVLPRIPPIRVREGDAGGGARDVERDL